MDAQDKTLYVTDKDLEEYFSTMKLTAKIRKFSKIVARNLPFKLREEFKYKYEGIGLIDPKKQVYQYFVNRPSKELKTAVSQFKIVVR